MGRVRFSQYAYETKTLPSGVKVDRNENILRALMTLAKAQNKSEDINEIEADTIEDARERFENNEYGNIEMVDNTFEGITFIEECVNE